MPIDRVVWEYWTGEEPETIRAHYPTLSLEQVKGAIDFYLGHREEVDAVIAERERLAEEFEKSHPWPAHLKEKLERARLELPARQLTDDSLPSGRRSELSDSYGL